MKKINVKAEHEYNVVIDCDWKVEVASLLKDRTRIAIIHSQDMGDSVRLDADIDAEVSYFAIPNGEDAKTFLTLSTIWNWLGAGGFTRSDAIVAVGGGAITDVAGFAAASWLRGIDWVGVPTTLAGMVDASVGGKTGINSDYGKNLIGAFHSPLSVFIDVSWLATLPKRDMAAGMAEVIKCGFIAETKIFEILEGQNLDTLCSDLPRIISLIEEAVAVKAQVVSSDFKESFVREILNYGHTLGHAVEIHSKYSLRHGEAVSIGLIFAAELANIKGEISTTLLEQHRRTLMSMNLPTTYPRQAWSELYPLLALDKKARGANLRFVIISAIGKTLRLEDVQEAELFKAYERISA